MLRWKTFALSALVLTGVCVLIGLTGACASSGGPDSLDEGDGAPVSLFDGALGSDSGPLSGDAAPSCADPLNEQGCACKPGTPPRSCYTGPKAQAGVGKCNLGLQQCMPTNQGELTKGVWGACTGEGQPLTCSGAGAQCGAVADGCGGVLDCGTCGQGLTCGGGGANRCGSGPCVPTTCAGQGIDCGPAGDGCGMMLDCGTCVAPQTCGGGGQPGRCACTPTTCGAQGATCGAIPDGCGGTLDCGSCVLPDTCGGSGTPNTCGQPPQVMDAGGGGDDAAAVCPAICESDGGWPPCVACNAQNCCATYTANANSPDYLSWRDCFLEQTCTAFCGPCSWTPPPPGYTECGTLVMPDAGEYECCESKYPPGFALEQAWESCLEANCKNECGL
jgi:hypothetical protein